MIPRPKLKSNSSSFTKVLIGARCYPPILLSQPKGLDVYPYTLIVSSVFAMATFVVHVILPELRNIHGVNIMCYLASMSATYVGFGFIQLHSLTMSEADCYYFRKSS